MELYGSLAVSLLLTLVLELLFALIWGVGRRELLLVALVNCLTNPVVVLCHFLVAGAYPALLLPVTIALEAGAVFTEGWIYRRRGKIRAPWLFSLCANAFSFAIGQLF